MSQSVVIAGQKFKGPVPALHRATIEAEAWRPPKLALPALVQYARGRGLRAWSTMLVTGVNERRIEGYVFEKDQVPRFKDRVYHQDDPMLNLQPRWLEEEDTGVYRETPFTKLTDKADDLLESLKMVESMVDTVTEISRRLIALEGKKAK